MASGKKKAVFSSQEDERLIEEVRKYPNLYNSSLNEYRDHGRSEQSWLAICRLLPEERTWREVKDRWKYLRDQYTKAKRSSVGRSGNPGGKKLKWKYYDLMSFLSDHVKHRDTDSNTSTSRSVTPQNETQVEDEPQIEIENEEYADEQSQEASGSQGPSRPQGPSSTQGSSASTGPTTSRGPSRSSAPSFSSTKKKKFASKTTDVDEAFVKYLKSRADSKDQDNCQYLFGKMVAASLMKLSPRNQSLAKLKIQQVLYEMEEKELTSTDGKAPPNPSFGQNFEFQQQNLASSLQHSMYSSYSPATPAAQPPPCNFVGSNNQTY